MSKEFLNVRCRCCECQGKHCLFPHPGHSCKMYKPTKEVERIIETLEKMQAEGSEGSIIRKFETGATRDTAEGKLEYNGFNCPLVEKRFAEYMNLHRKQTDGNLRASDNWKKGIPIGVYKHSLHRHFMDLWLHLEGYPDEAVDKDIESVLSAIRFNVNGMLHEILKGKKNERKADKA